MAGCPALARKLAKTGQGVFSDPLFSASWPVLPSLSVGCKKLQDYGLL